MLLPGNLRWVRFRFLDPHNNNMHIKAQQLKVMHKMWLGDTSGQHCPGILPHEGEADATVHGGYNHI